jgi:hypothetical protein
MARIRLLSSSARLAGRCLYATAQDPHRIAASLRQHPSRSAACLTTLHEPCVVPTASAPLLHRGGTGAGLQICGESTCTASPGHRRGAHRPDRDSSRTTAAEWVLVLADDVDPGTRSVGASRPSTGARGPGPGTLDARRRRGRRSRAGAPLGRFRRRPQGRQQGTAQPGRRPRRPIPSWFRRGNWSSKRWRPTGRSGSSGSMSTASRPRSARARSTEPNCANMRCGSPRRSAGARWIRARNNSWRTYLSGSSRFLVNEPAERGVHAAVRAALASRIRAR